MTKRIELTGLTALRFFSAIFVLGFHSRHFVDGSFLEIPVFAFFSSGWLGVDIFFVLSGFVISYVYDKDFKFKQYSLHRVARIYPIYLFTTIAALITVAIYGKPDYSKFDNFDVLMNFFLVQSWYSDWTNSVNWVSWTVSAEWAIYLMFPIIIRLARILPVNWLGIMLPVSAFAFLGGLEGIGLPGAINKCLFEFCSGIMLFRYWEKFGGFGPSIKIIAIFSALAMIFLEAWFSFLDYSLNSAYLSVLAVPIVAWGVGWNTQSTLLLIGGRASYSIYLVHGVVHLLLRSVIQIGMCDYVWGFPLFWFFSLGIAYLMYIWVEQPARRWIVKTWT